VRLVAVVNQKGGVGKTTTAVNLGAALARRGRRVLLVDMDPQGNLTDHLLPDAAEGTDGEEAAPRASVYDVLVEGRAAKDCVVPTATPGLFVLPSHADLAGAELDLASVIGREVILRDAIAALPKDAYDWVFFDCPPSLGLLSLNALAAADEVLIVLQTEFFAMRGLGALDRTVDLVRKRINPRLKVGGILATLVDPVTRLSREVIDEVREHYGDLVFATRIRKNVRLAEAPSHRMTVFDYAPESAGDHDYSSLALEVEQGRAAVAAALRADAAPHATPAPAPAPMPKSPPPRREVPPPLAPAAASRATTAPRPAVPSPAAPRAPVASPPAPPPAATPSAASAPRAPAPLPRPAPSRTPAPFFRPAVPAPTPRPLATPMAPVASAPAATSLPRPATSLPRATPQAPPPTVAAPIAIRPSIAVLGRTESGSSTV
jgi:chromosome partitioning protein